MTPYLRTVEMSGWYYSCPDAYISKAVFVYILPLIKITVVPGELHAVSHSHPTIPQRQRCFYV